MFTQYKSEFKFAFVKPLVQTISKNHTVLQKNVTFKGEQTRGHIEKAVIAAVDAIYPIKKQEF